MGHRSPCAVPEARLDAAAAVRSGEAPVGGGGAVAAAAVAAAAGGGGGAGPSYNVFFIQFKSYALLFTSSHRWKKEFVLLLPFLSSLFLLSLSLSLGRASALSCCEDDGPDPAPTVASSSSSSFPLFFSVCPPPPSPTSAQETGRRAPWLPSRADICVFVN